MPESIHPNTRLGAVYLTVSNLERSLEWYQSVLGFKIHDHRSDVARLGAGGDDLLVLTEKQGARKYDGTTGLYHYAILLPSRLEIARALRRISETRTPVDGIVDHWISEAIYLPDPDGIGIEVYADRPREQWPPLDYLIRFGNAPMDVEGVLGELENADSPWMGMHPDTVIGHIHLHVANVRDAEEFYHGILGFDRMMHYGSTAGFVSAGGYHHHIGYNTWAGTDAPTPPPDAIGLRWFVIQLPNFAELSRVAARVRHAGIQFQERDDGVFIRDPSQNGVLLTSREVAR